MEDAEFSDAFCRFVQAHLPTVDEAETLIALHRNPDARSALVARYGEESLPHVDTLARAYEERPVTLVRLIYALRDRKIVSFADAFKLRKP